MRHITRVRQQLNITRQQRLIHPNPCNVDLVGSRKATVCIPPRRHACAIRDLVRREVLRADDKAGLADERGDEDDVGVPVRIPVIVFSLLPFPAHRMKGKEQHTPKPIVRIVTRTIFRAPSIDTRNALEVTLEPVIHRTGDGSLQPRILRVLFSSRKAAVPSS